MEVPKDRKKECKAHHKKLLSWAKKRHVDIRDIVEASKDISTIMTQVEVGSM